ncbi:MAG: hypothetical protein GY822_03075 [Deltaproteobacteria bacterium]|nr:hypothetical protein [Deltaproteobacteria bacterium]
MASDGEYTRPVAAAIRWGVILLLVDSEDGALRMIHADTLTPYKLATTIPLGNPRHMVVTTKQALLVEGDN